MKETLGTIFTILFVVVFLVIGIQIFMQQPLWLALGFFLIFGGTAVWSSYRVIKYWINRLK